MISIILEQKLADEYSKILSKMAFPKVNLPTNLHILCFDVVNCNNVIHKITTDHHHTFFEIHLVLSGEITYECQGEKITLSSNTALLVPDGLEHRYVSSSDDLTKCVISFSLDKACYEIGSDKAPVFTIPENVLESLTSIFNLCTSNDAFTPHLIMNRIVEVIYYAFRALEVALPNSSQKEVDPRFLVAQAFIEKNRHRILSCDDVAKECCLSAKQLGRIVYASTGLSLSQYITASKLEFAKELLNETTSSIKEICFLLGFESEASFTLFFKRHTGTPPKLYRTKAPKTTAGETIISNKSS